MNFQEQITVKTDQELIEIYTHPDAYQPAFVDLAYAELNKRGVDMQDYEMLKKERLQAGLIQLQEKPGEELFLFLGFMLSFMGGLFGIIMGYNYSQSAEIGPSGEKLFVYNKSTRDKGSLMMIIGIFCMVSFALLLYGNLL